MTSIRELVEPEAPPPASFTGTPWHALRFVGFDLETTSPDPEEARIVVASVCEVGGRRPTTSRSWLVDPDIEIPDEAVAIHGITTAQAQDAGELAADAVAAIVDMLAARPAGCPLVGFNVRYDLTVLDREARRCGVVPLIDRGELLAVDPLVCDRHLDRYRPGSRKLEAVCAYYRVILDGAHDADFDAIAAARLAWRIARNARVVRRDEWEEQPLQAEWDRVRHDARALHEAQRGWAREQILSLAAYFRRIGNPEAAARCAAEAGTWPVVPYAG